MPPPSISQGVEIVLPEHQRGEVLLGVGGGGLHGSLCLAGPRAGGRWW